MDVYYDPQLLQLQMATFLADEDDRTPDSDSLKSK